jgi:vitamin B12/bleomycin/antimicrobial peptide transport system ATP-binding/permease protein
MASQQRSPWSRMVIVGKPFFVSRMRWRAAGALALIVALLLTLNGLNVANSYVGRSFISALSERQRHRYFKFALLYLGVFTASTATGVLNQFVQDRLALLWREWLTRQFIDRYLSGHMFDWISTKKDIDNPDQRIAEDVRTFTGTLLSFVVMMVNAGLTTIAFAGVLWSITPVLLLAAVLYAVFGSLFTVALGYRLVHLNNQQLKKEADLRHALINLREAPEPSSAREPKGRRVQALLQRVIRNSRAIIGVNRNVGFFTSGYNYLVQIIPILIVAPRYLRGEVEFGVVTQAAMAFAQLLGAFSLIVAQFNSISTFTAVIRRLGSLWEAMEVGPDGAWVAHTAG